MIDPDLTLARVAAWDDLALAAIKLCLANDAAGDLTRARLFLCLADRCRDIADEHRRAFNSADLLLTSWSSYAKLAV